MKSSKRQILFNDLTFEMFPSVYEPAEDSFLAAENLAINPNDVVLDMGTGCGILAIVAAQKAKRVVAVDINPHAIHCAKRNAEINKIGGQIEIRKGYLFQPIQKEERFSLIIFNAPYLPTPPNESKSWLSKSWAGGPTGRHIIDQFVSAAPKHLEKDGRILLVQSSLTNIGETQRRFLKSGLVSEIVAQQKVAFETIVMIQAKSYISNAQK